MLQNEFVGVKQVWKKYELMEDIMSNYTENIKNKAKVAKQYEESNNLSQRISLHEKYSTNPYGLSNWLFDQYSFSDGDNILELGCGTGGQWKGRIPENAKLVLTDFSEGMIKEVKGKYKEHSNIIARKADIQNISFEDSHFDIAIANFMLYHVPDLERALAEVVRVLKPGGKFYTATCGNNHLIEVNRWFNEYNPEYDIFNSSKLSFTLQNGVEQLKRYFTDVQMKEYADALEINDVDDLVNYILTFNDMVNIGKNELSDIREHLITKQNKDGIIHLSKQIGIFIAKKTSIEICKNW